MFDGQIGALEIGIIVSIFLFGVTTAQTFLYYQLFPLDSKWMKRLVWAVWLIELGHSISALHALYFYTVLQFGNQAVGTMKVPLSIALNLIISEVVFVLVQGYYITRIYRFSRTWYISGLCVILLVVRFVGTVVATVEATIMTSLDQYTTDWEWDLVGILSVGAFTDLAIPCVLVYYLAMKRSSAYDTTLAIVDKLILWTIETGLLTGLLAVLILIFFKTLPGRFAWMAVYMNLPKMFSNSFLANLNSRFKLRAMNEKVDVVDMSADATLDRNTIHFPHRLGARVNITSQQTKTVDDGMPPVQYTSNDPFKIEMQNRNSSDDADAEDGTQSTSSRDRKAPVIDITI
ncbi:hypothetical protein E1B28_002439 [Marasmius oreades]|uniref:DUF6534 domain-containing protein n=1 Tax=Marasmius oreades TaxID=181124 RepID=A0A9P7RN09_9AGAR|nr:uncharacterized protein E1B28_002439 [Marasmius oreades]KAG7086490.1 hypothetical protein E1B28_002439 [Marasmius oreades]